MSVSARRASYRTRPRITRFVSRSSLNDSDMQNSVRDNDDITENKVVRVSNVNSGQV